MVHALGRWVCEGREEKTFGVGQLPLSVSIIQLSQCHSHAFCLLPLSQAVGWTGLILLGALPGYTLFFPLPLVMVSLIKF